MKIQRLRIINFKNFEQEHNFDFQDSNLIVGKNGSGKSTIKDAIISCLYNRTPDGSSADSSRFITNGKMKSLSEVAFEHNGQEHVIRRERTNKQTRITYVDSSQSEEDNKITQETLEGIIPHFYNFSAVFNIGWFMSLTDREKRSYILNLTPSYSRVQIYEKMDGKSEDIAKFSLDFENIEKTHKNLLTFRRNNELTIESLKNFNSHSIPVEIPQPKLSDYSQELEKLEKESKKYFDNYLKRKEYDRIKNNNQEVELKNKELERKIASLKIEDISYPSQDKINELKIKINEYSQSISLPEKTCPTCLQVVAAKHRDKIEKINATNRKNLEETKRILQAEERSYRDVLAKWEKNEENKKLKLMYESQFSDPIPLPQEPEKMDTSIDYESEIKEIRKKQEDFLKEKNTIQILSQEEEKRKRQIDSNIQKIAEFSELVQKFTKLIAIFSPSGIPAEEMRLKLDPLKESFQKLLPDSNITTLEPLKNEMGYKEVFKISINGKDYSKLSLGEKTRVDISLSQIINSLLKEKINCFFLDNSEVLDGYVSLPSQSFVCKVSNQPLKIN